MECRIPPNWDEEFSTDKAVGLVGVHCHGHSSFEPAATLCVKCLLPQPWLLASYSVLSFPLLKGELRCIYDGSATIKYSFSCACLDYEDEASFQPEYKPVVHTLLGSQVHGEQGR
jgi:hypothetical protein